MTAPSIKEALEPCPFCASRPHKGPTKMERCQLHGEPFQMYAIWCPRGHAKIVAADQERSVGEWNTRATLQPSGERREAIARILADPKHQERARYVQGFLYGDDHVIRDVALRENQELFRTKDEHEYEQRLEIEKAKFAAGAILASGLVQNEAGIMAEPTNAQVRSACMSFRHDYGLLPKDKRELLNFEAREWLHAWQKEGFAIRSARDGGAET